MPHTDELIREKLEHLLRDEKLRLTENDIYLKFRADPKVRWIDFKEVEHVLSRMDSAQQVFTTFRGGVIARHTAEYQWAFPEALKAHMEKWMDEHARFCAETAVKSPGTCCLVDARMWAYLDKGDNEQRFQALFDKYKAEFLEKEAV